MCLSVRGWWCVHACCASSANIVGPGHLIVDPDVMASYAIDWTGRFVGQPTAVVRPGDGREVAAVVSLCKDAGVALVPQGGNTGLVGGSVPLEREVVLSLRRLAGVSDVDALGGQLSAGAGTTVADVQVAAAEAGWAYGVDLGSRAQRNDRGHHRHQRRWAPGAPPWPHEGATRGL